MKKIISLLLCLAMLLPALAGCSETNPEDDAASENPAAESETAPVEEEEPEVSRANMPDNLPADLDFGGQTFGQFSQTESKVEEFYRGPEELTGEVVADAVYQRNVKVADRLNIAFNFVSTSGDFVSDVKNLVMSGDTSYDYFTGNQYQITPIITSNCFLNSFDAPYLDYDQPWWNTVYMDELALGSGFRYFLVGDYALDAVAQERVVFYNKNLYGQLYGDPDGLYQNAIEGTWTIDLMTDLAEGAYIDTDGNGQTDETDMLGFITYATYSSVDAFVYGSDVKFSSRDENGYVVLELMSDRALLLLDKLNRLFHNQCSFYNTDGRNVAQFATGTALFLGNATFLHAKELREMEDDYGYLPYPKLDESQTEYRSLVHDTVDIGAVSICCNKLELAYAALEALTAETYRTVTPAYYETALKSKYARDEISQQMIDVVHDAMTTSFVFAYNYAISNAGLLFRDLVTNNSNDYASAVKRSEKAANKLLSKIVEHFTNEEAGE